MSLQDKIANASVLVPVLFELSNNVNLPTDLRASAQAQANLLFNFLINASNQILAT